MSCTVEPAFLAPYAVLVPYAVMDVTSVALNPNGCNPNC